MTDHSSPVNARDPLAGLIASLAAAISLLENTPKAKKGAPSDTMFETMLSDYRKALKAGRQFAQKYRDAYEHGYNDGCEWQATRGINAQSTPEPVTYQLRFRRESGEWSEWQNVVSPWDGSRNPAWEYRPLYAAFSSPKCGDGA